MFSGVDLPDESSPFPFGDLVGVVDDADFNLDLGPQDMFQDPNVDFCLFGMPDAVLPEPTVDTSDSDSGISNHGDKLQSLLCDIKQGSFDLPDLGASTSVQLPPVTEVASITGAEATVCKTLSSQLKRPRPFEPLIIGSRDPTAPSTPASLTRTFPHGTALVKPELSGCTSTFRQIPASNHVSPKIPRILSRGQNGTGRTTAPSTRAACGLQPGGYNTTSSREQEHHTALVPAVVSLPVIDEFTFSNSFQVISPPTESESFEKLVKKQERMIKNRQAACLSRLRKKEYLERLEHRLDQLRQENAHLRQENNEWRHRYDHLERCLGDLQAEFASLRRSSDTSVGGVGLSPIASPSPPPPACSSSSPSLPQHHSPPLLQRPLLASTTASQLGVVSKVPLLRKQDAERTVLQKSGHGGDILGSNRVIGGVGLPRGVRKKVTTSLFAVVCLFLMNFCLTPLGQLGGTLTTTFSGSKNLGVVSSNDYDGIFPKVPLGGRILLSTSSVQDVVGAVQSSKNRTSAPRLVGSSVRSTVNTASNEEGEVVWIVFDEIDKSIDWPVFERRKRLAHYRHGQAEAEPPLKWHVTRTNRFGRAQRRRLHKAYLVRPLQGESMAGWSEDNLPDSLYLFGRSTSSNLTIFLRNEALAPHLSSEEANATDKNLRLCKLQVQISSLKDLRRRRKV
ncbi:putative basic-leucine zipper transcription factor D [Echinococcus granulosus]|uniref:Basic-leucine zipper transcription factor D n=1 Tax=Echinococcus granulosus TaxID=6210 RepID=W6UJ06_ECHGR|nr:putative basic-leucine zipper transcription factor D [Echinococcus granulosus]EUB61018.1 putative basic-leucine zipper transcription factor D [Echinococcus granulosus]KAH9284392.1 putative basic-leucine zipper transcription factor D [Echinococcus granulosus]